MRRPMLDRMADAVQQAVQEATRLGAQAAKARFAQTESISCEFEAGVLKATSSEQGRALSLEVIRNGKRATVTCNDPGDIPALAARAVALVEIGAAAHFSAYPQPSECAQILRHCPETASLPRERLIEAGQRVVEGIRAYSSGLYIGAEAGRSEAEAVIAHSSGLLHSATTTRWNLGGYAQKTDGTDMLFCGAGRQWRRLNDWFDADWVARETLQDLRLAERTAPPPTGMVTVLAPPEAAAMLLAPLAMACSGRSVLKGESPLRDKLGEAIGSSSLDITDQPHVDWATESAAMDDCGVPTRPFTLVERGVLQAFMYDMDTAAMAGVDPTGHAGCRPVQMRLQPGGRTSAEMLNGLSEGLIVKNLMGFGQSNLMNGDIAGNVALGYRVENGATVGRVKNTMVAANLYELLRGGFEASSDVDPLTGWPWIMLEGVSVSSGG
ncbi:MAG: metallopeptidase TldD-related protein [Armatimonadetes bacterium]|nr:metallopeptidase TldD-related protein [Armatimonadota bacterium]